MNRVETTATTHLWLFLRRKSSLLVVAGHLLAAKPDDGLFTGLVEC